MKSLLQVIGFALLFGGFRSFGQQAAPAPSSTSPAPPVPIVELDKVMTKEKQKETGLDTLSADQRLKLENWLSDFAMRIALARSSGGSVVANKATTLGAYAGLGGNHWVADKLDDGDMIKLDDGSLWEISSLDKINSALWLTTDDIVVTKSDDPLYPYKLVNTSDKDSAEAKLISK